MSGKGVWLCVDRFTLMIIIVPNQSCFYDTVDIRLYCCCCCCWPDWKRKKKREMREMRDTRERWERREWERIEDGACIELYLDPWSYNIIIDTWIQLRFMPLFPSFHSIPFRVLAVISSLSSCLVFSRLVNFKKGVLLLWLDPLDDDVCYVPVLCLYGMCVVWLCLLSLKVRNWKEKAHHKITDPLIMIMIIWSWWIVT